MQEGQGQPTDLVPALQGAWEVSCTAGQLTCGTINKAVLGHSKERLASLGPTPCPGAIGSEGGVGGAVSLNPEQQEAPTQYYNQLDGGGGC